MAAKPRQNETLEIGTLISFETGEYDMRDNHGPYETCKRFVIAEAAAEYRKSEQKKKTGWDFISWLERSGYIREPSAPTEWFWIGDNGEVWG